MAVEVKERQTGIFFDRFWKNQEPERVDKRTLQRWEFVEANLGLLPGKKILDVGAGRGLTARMLAEAGFDVSACDVSSGSVNLLRQQGLVSFVFDLEEDELEQKYDAIFCMEVLQYLRYPEKTVAKLKAALNPDGVLVISVPNEFHLLRRLEILFGRTGWAGTITPHLRLFDRKTAAFLFRQCGLQTVKMIPVTLCPPGFWGERLGRVLAAWFPDWFSLSIIFYLRSDDGASTAN
ncbi:MAG: class I SAM-dependent methyltransferase [candidate division Zixibacteria bacterium]|nr:class I SAM-dependent methyltransferase [candidate division Zixibacteria bacterium]MCI0597388.1 class I SAM-dependent methyltransferase [candidate division Zixibacteria bacterium]